MQNLRPLAPQMIGQLIISLQIDLFTLNPCMYPKYLLVEGATKCKLIEISSLRSESNKNFWMYRKITPIHSGCKPAFWMHRMQKNVHSFFLLMPYRSCVRQGAGWLTIYHDGKFECLEGLLFALWLSHSGLKYYD